MARVSRFAPWLLRRLIPGAALGCFCAAALAQSEALPAPVLRALAEAGVPPSAVAAVVQDVDAPRPSLRANADAPLNPASAMKLVTTFAALELLGPAYRWKTEVYTAGTLAGGALSGHLILKGYGDPKLTLESFWLLLRNVQGRGVRELRGDLVLDRTYFDAANHDPGRFDAEPLRPYNVGPDALLVNFKSVRFQFVPEPDTKSVRVFAEPRPRALQVASALKLSNGPCGDWRAKLKPDFQPAGSEGLRAVFAGTYAESCGERAWNVALFGHREYVATLFRHLWEELGGSWSGAAHDGATPGEARLLYTHESETLSEILRDMNKYSNNVMARQLYLTLGAESAGAPARPEIALQAVRAALARHGLDFPELVIENGSGLSRIERISAGSLARLLVAAYRSAAMPEFVASLPLVAVDGTLRRRMNGEPVAGRAHVKSGTLADVRAVAGYVLDRAGRRQAAVMIVNHPNAPLAQPALDALLGWVYEGR
jgi:D-alanyl-D-alanine carboxypeptidase/D-alanyl-D-alanine-endopeptidase (penicillin-binding protein 4)